MRRPDLVLSFTANDHGRVASGEITVSFRLWKYGHVKAGKTYQTGFGGQVFIEAVELMPAAFVSLEDALLAGHPSIEAAWQAAGNHTGTTITPDTLLYRVHFRYLPDGPPSAATAADFDAIRKRLVRMDSTAHRGPWTAQTLRLIDAHPGLRAAHLMRMAGREDLVSFKADVRKLKALGLTTSLETGYRLSETGRAVVALL